MKRASKRVRKSNNGEENSRQISDGSTNRKSHTHNKIKTNERVRESIQKDKGERKKNKREEHREEPRDIPCLIQEQEKRLIVCKP